MNLVISVLNALTRIMPRELENGNRVHLDGLGYFYLTLSCPPVDSPKEVTPKVSGTLRIYKQYCCPLPEDAGEKSKIMQKSTFAPVV